MGRIIEAPGPIGGALWRACDTAARRADAHQRARILRDAADQLWSQSRGDLTIAFAFVDTETAANRQESIGNGEAPGVKGHRYSRQLAEQLNGLV